MTKTRGFEIVSKYEEQGLNLPARTTVNAAGYDFEASQETFIPSVLKQAKRLGIDLESVANGIISDELKKAFKPVLVPTGIKSYMQPNEYLQLVSRSSAPIKKQIMMPNAIGIVDADYYNNDSNEGEIFFQFINFGVEDVVIQKGERIGQGIFLPYLVADGDELMAKSIRQGGFGSTGN